MKKPDYEELKGKVAGAQRVRRDGYEMRLEGLARAGQVSGGEAFVFTWGTGEVLEGVSGEVITFAV